ncbi:MAG: hypothetical protein ABJB47_08285 [Actinomycetota bacterium]
MPFPIDTTVTWILTPCWGFTVIKDDGTQRTVAVWPTATCAPGGVSAPGAPAGPDTAAPGWAGGDVLVPVVLPPQAPSPGISRAAAMPAVIQPDYIFSPLLCDAPGAVP